MEKQLTKMHYILLLILSLVPLFMVLIVFPYLPDPMPAHFSLGGEVNRWGSRNESFLMPAIALALGSFMMWVTKFSEKRDDYAGRMVFFVSVGTSVLMIAVTASILYMTISSVN